MHGSSSIGSSMRRRSKSSSPRIAALSVRAWTCVRQSFSARLSQEV